MSDNQSAVVNNASRAVGESDPTFDVGRTLKSGGRGVFPEPDTGGDQKFYIVEFETGLIRPGPSHISRYNADGTRDVNFHGGEKLEIPSLIPGIPNVDDIFARIYIQGIMFNADETITCVGVAGAEDVNKSYYAPAAIRITSKGEMDTSFGNKQSPEINDGTAIYFTGYANSTPDRVLFPLDGPVRWNSQPGKDILFFSRIHADGELHGLYYLVKMKPGGQLDRQFGIQGLLSIDEGRDAILNAYSVDDQGRVTVAGYYKERGQGVVLRYTDAGEPDLGFGEGGRVLIETPEGGLIKIVNLNVAADGKTTLLVTYEESGGTKLALMRRLENGEADLEFQGGRPLVVDSLTTNGLHTLQVDDMGRYIISSSNKTHLTRVTATGALDSDFGGTGSIDYPDFSYLKAEAVQRGVDLLATVRQGPAGASSLVRFSGSDSRSDAIVSSAAGDRGPDVVTEG